ncbi:hypothetical protein Goe19_00850 [Bacillus phage vB_BsuM-Goe19]|nr:hypothetical protein Goe19_00850 [Bacillus phage vB_BsuM-Goe19]
MASSNRDVRLSMSMDTSDAIRSLREFERQTEKLGSLADQGEKLQNGFLSRRQVQTYRGIMSEMAGVYTRYKDQLSQIDKKYEDLQKTEEVRKLRELENNLKRRQQLYSQATGNNRWGDQASPKVQQYHKDQLASAQQQLNAYQGDSTLKQILQEIKDTEASRSAMTAAVENLSAQNDRAQTYASRINSMYEQDPQSRRYANAAVRTLSATGAITSLGGYVGYTMSGIDKLREQERLSQNVTQRMDAYYGTPIADSEQREAIQSMGESYGYNTAEVAQAQQSQLDGGSQGSIEKFNSDTDSLLKTSRSLALDPTSMAQNTSMLRKMGAMDEGDMQKFANLLAGAISKTGTSGREEEMLQATTSLLQSVSQGQAKLSSQDMDNVVGIQTAMGEAVPELTGDRGAALLSTIDANIKNGDSSLDLLMGKGTEFVGLSGMTKLEELKEQGISNPENLQRILNNADTMFNGNEDMIKLSLKEKLGLQINEYNALKKGGFIDRIKKGDMPTSKELKDAGLDSLSKKWDKYDSSETGRLNSLDSQGENLQADHAKAADEVAKDSRGLWHSLPDWMQHGLLPAAGIGGAGLAIAKGGVLMRGATGALQRVFGRNIGSGGAGGTGAGAGGSMASTLRGWFGSASGAADDVTTGTSSALRGTANYADDLARFSGGSLDTFLKGASKKLPYVGGLLTVGLDRAENPDSDWGRSLAKGVGSVVGGLLGGAGAVALGIGTGGAGLLATGAMAAGGGAAGEATGDWLYSLFNGEEDSKKGKDKDSSKESEQSLSKDSKETPLSSADPNITNTSTSGTNADPSEKDLSVSKMYIDDKDLSAMFANSSTPGLNGKDLNVNINVSGAIDGMDKDNQDQVNESIKDWFKKSITTNMFGSSGLNLANDQYRA